MKINNNKVKLNNRGKKRTTKQKKLIYLYFLCYYIKEFRKIKLVTKI